MTGPGLVALAWQDDATTAVAQRAAAIVGAVDLPVVARQRGLILLASSARTLSEGRIWLVGEVLESGHAWPDAPGLDMARGTPRAVARAVTDSFWGAHAAIFVDGARSYAMVEGSGALPLQLARASGLTLLSDRLTPALLQMLGHERSIDWPALAATLLTPAAAVHLPLLLDVCPLVAGSLHRLDAPGSQAIWTPTTAVLAGDPDPPALRRAIDFCTSSLAGPRPLVQLSGGLDSSIVLASARAQDLSAAALTFATEGRGGDERHYAREAARAAAAPLTEIRTDRLPDPTRLIEVEQLARPYLYGLDDVFEETAQAAAAAGAFERMLTGQGGDAVFLQPPTHLVSVDRFRAEGFRALRLALLLDDARRCGTSIWGPIFQVVADAVRPAAVPTQPIAPHLLTAEACEAAGTRPGQHPWLDDASTLPPAKRLQITMIANSQIFHSPRPFTGGKIVHPLLARPVLDAALAIPCHMLATGPLDRGLARSLFADRLPAAIAARRSKGEASDQYSRAALAHVDRLRELLCEGALVSAGVLDGNGIDRLLRPGQLFMSSDYRAVTMLASCEAWARAWRRA